MRRKQYDFTALRASSFILRTRLRGSSSRLYLRLLHIAAQVYNIFTLWQSGNLDQLRV